MSLTEELRDPWGLRVAGLAGGMAWAVMATPVVGLGVGAAVLGVKVVTGLLTGGERERPATVRPVVGSAAAHWLGRAEQAVREVDELQVPGVAYEAQDTLAAVERLASQSRALDRALARVDLPGLDQEASRLSVQALVPGPAQGEVQRSAAAVADRVAVRDRLRSAHEAVLARMQSGALGLEGVVARLAEVAAMSHSTGVDHDASGQVAELALEVEGLRVGLVEVEALSRGALARGLDGTRTGKD